MTVNLTDEEIKKAAAQVRIAIDRYDAIPAEQVSFSEKHERAMLAMFAGKNRRDRARRAARRISVCFIVLVVALLGSCLVFPGVRAAVSNWSLYVLEPDRVVYEFHHNEKDKAFVIARPSVLPAGFECVALDETPGRSLQRYEDRATGEYLIFDYHWLTVREQRKLNRLKNKYGVTHLYMDNEAVSYSEKGISKLCWSDSRGIIGFWAESNMYSEELIKAFSANSEHVAMFEPSWLPDGYKLCFQSADYGSRTLVYQDEFEQNKLYITVHDLGKTDYLFVEGEAASEDITINGRRGKIYIGKNGSQIGARLILIDDVENYIIKIDAGSAEKDIVIKVAEGLEKVDALTRYLP